MTKKKIFLASSSELKEDREQFEIFINRKNIEWHNKGVFLELVIWENFLDAMSKTRLQDEYNKAIIDCDIFIMLFFTKVGKYTQEEFETAFGQFKKTGRPLIYTFFRDSNINTGSIDDTILSMLSFKRKIEQLGHFVTVYQNIAELKLKFSEQLTKLADKGLIEIDQSEKEIFTRSKYSKELTNALPKTHPENIVGREEDLEALHDLLYDDKKVIVVNGLGGIGKTTLVQAYVSKYYEDYAHIVWITQDVENIINDFLNAEGLLQNLEIEAANAEPQQLFSEVIRKLKAIREKPNLLVIDNAEQSLKQYKDLLPSQPNWHLLVTSREEIMGFQIQPIGFLNEAQSIQLFKKYYTHHRLTGEDIKQLVQYVDYHTLTIEILAKTAQVQRYDAATLQQAIEKDIKAHVQVLRESGEVERVATYLTSVFNMSKLNEEEIWLMKQFVCLPSEFQTYALLTELLVNKESAHKDSLAETCNKISQKGWLQYNAATDSYKMHRIVAGVVKRQHVINKEDVKILIETITAKLSLDQAKDNPVDKFILIPFGKNLLDYFNDDDSAGISTLQNNLAMVLQYLGDYERARVLLEKSMVSDEKNFGKDHPITARSYSNLGMLLKDVGNYEGAKVLLEKALASYEKNFGKSHPSTAISYSNLALLLKDIGDYEGARVLLEKSLASYEKNFGKSHPSTVLIYSNLAMVIQDLGDYEAARVLLEKVSASDEKNFGKDHPSTAISYSNLALVLRVLGDYDGARVLLEKSMASDEKNFGKDHPSTARNYSNLGVVLQDLGDYDGARVLLEKSMVSAEKNFGEGHPSTAITYSNLALMLQDLGDYREAKALLEKALASDEKNFGKVHPSTARSSSNLAGVLIGLGDYEGAKVLLEKASASDQKIFGKDHPTTALGYSNLAAVLKDLGDYKKALELSAKAVAIFRKSLPEGHPDIKVVGDIYESIKEKLERK